jgi:hypothetical protein
MAKRKTPLHETVEKERQVLELRIANARWEDIATIVGYASAGAAYNAYARALKRTLQEPSDEIRQQERERLDRLGNAVYRQAIQGDVRAIQTMLKIMERRAKLLGLDSPIKQQVEVTTYEGGSELDREIQRLVDLLATDSSKPSDVDTQPSTTESTTA